MMKFLTDQSFDSGEEYLKFPDGTLIQWGYIKISINADGTHSASTTVKYPIREVKSFGVFFSNVFSYSNQNIWSIAGRREDGFDAYFYNIGGLNKGSTCDANWFSIGRWK